jgi:hypothetical protein
VDEFSGITIHAGPFFENGKEVYYYEIRLVASDVPPVTEGLDTELAERMLNEFYQSLDLKFALNSVRAYNGELKQVFGYRVYRRLLRSRLPTPPYPWKGDCEAEIDREKCRYDKEHPYQEKNPVSDRLEMENTTIPKKPPRKKKK